MPVLTGTCPRVTVTSSTGQGSAALGSRGTTRQPPREAASRVTGKAEGGPEEGGKAALLSRGGQTPSLVSMARTKLSAAEFQADRYLSEPCAS